MNNTARHRPRIALGTLLLSLVAATATGATEALPREWIIDDNAQRASFQKGLVKLHEEGRCCDAEILRKQLDRDTPIDQPLPTPSSTLAPLSELYGRIKPAVLVVGALYKCGKCDKWHLSTATAFALARNGTIATNYHVIENTERTTFAVMTPDGKIHPVTEVLAANRHDDIAILATTADSLTPLPLQTAPPGTAISVISHPDRRLFTMTSGHVARYARSRSKRGGTAVRMEITADFAKGSSGGPVFDSCGNVAGMVASTQSIYYDNKGGKQENLQMVVHACVPAASIRALFKP